MKSGKGENARKSCYIKHLNITCTYNIDITNRLFYDYILRMM